VPEKAGVSPARSFLSGGRPAIFTGLFPRERLNSLWNCRHVQVQCSGGSQSLAPEFGTKQFSQICRSVFGGRYKKQIEKTPKIRSDAAKAIS
jgi:hypothetical protein